jgi:D-alanine-D-alanine ligase
VKPKIAVLMGGRSLERSVSLDSGERVVRALTARGYRVIALDIVPELADTLASEKPDAVYIALHGKLGEDGTVQSLLELLGIPYTGPNVLASMLAWDKDLSKLLFLKNGISTPPWVAFSSSAAKHMGAIGALGLVADRVGGYPLAVKPAEQGSALGRARRADSEALAEAMLDAFAYDSKVLVEKWIIGTEIAISVIDGPDGPEALPPVEIVPKAGLYDHSAMYTLGETEYFVPARLSEKTLEAACDVAKRVYVLLGCRDVSRVDMVVTDDGTPFVLECSTLPGMTETSVMLMSAEAAGIEFEDFVDRLTRAALSRK